MIVTLTIIYQSPAFCEIALPVGIVFLVQPHLFPASKRYGHARQFDKCLHAAFQDINEHIPHLTEVLFLDFICSWKWHEVSDRLKGEHIIIKQAVEAHVLET